MKAAASRPRQPRAGTFWYYNNWDFNALAHLDQLSGEKDIYTAFDKRIADSIGMQDYDPGELSYAYEPYSRHPYYGFRHEHPRPGALRLLSCAMDAGASRQVIRPTGCGRAQASHSIIGRRAATGYLW